MAGIGKENLFLAFRSSQITDERIIPKGSIRELHLSQLSRLTLLFSFCNEARDSLTKHVFPCILPWCFLIV